MFYCHGNLHEKTPFCKPLSVCLVGINIWADFELFIQHKIDEYAGLCLSCVQLLCLEVKLSPQVLSALEEDSQMARLMACRSLSAILRLIGSSLHPEALNKIYPGT